MPRVFLHASVAACLVLMAHAATAADVEATPDAQPSGGAMVFDLLLVRPVSLVATVLGTALFIVQLPLAVIQGDEGSHAGEKLVLAPARYTFTRPLGQME
jgi:hypothetical protein